jgi:hypothetical protein
MKISSNSWHARFFRTLEKDDRQPSVCKYWSCVLVFMPLFWLMLGPVWLVGHAIIKLLDGLDWLLGNIGFSKPKLPTVVCPFGSIEFEAEEPEPEKKR